MIVVMGVSVRLCRELTGAGQDKVKCLRNVSLAQDRSFGLVTTNNGNKATRETQSVLGCSWIMAPLAMQDASSMLLFCKKL